MLCKQLQQGLAELGEDPASHPCGAYLSYIELLSKWNRTYNLTGIKTQEKMLTHHILDSLSVLPYINGCFCLDVGSGAGLPGIILALARPEHEWLLLDSNSKKIRFLNQAVLELKLDNVEVVRTRGEDYLPKQRFSTVISRALSSLANFRNIASRLVREDGLLLAMKGTEPVQELKELGAKGVSFKLNEIKVPGINAQRHIVVMFG